MKKTIITLSIFALSCVAFAQNPERLERIKSLKVAFITEKLSLTETEAQQFWPIYNKYEEANFNIRRENRSERADYDFKSLSDQDANKLLNSMMDSEREKYELRQQLINDLKKVLPAQKILKLQWTEDQFNRRLLEEMRKRRGAMNGKE
jgi:Spy/CpxP family protein refolding chaperone